MNKNRLKILAYVAGIIDGEGHIGITKQNRLYCKTRKRATGYSLRIAVKMCDGDVIDFLYGNFGGHVGRILIEGYKSEQYQWVINCRKAAQLLKDILPFLRAKKAQAELAMRFQFRKERRQGKRRSREFDEWCYQEMKRLHRIHKPSECYTHTCGQVQRLSETTPKGDAIVQTKNEGKLLSY